MVERNSLDSGPREYGRDRPSRARGQFCKANWESLEVLASSQVSRMIWFRTGRSTLTSCFSARSIVRPTICQLVLNANFGRLTALVERDAIVSRIEAGARREVGTACRKILRRFDAA